MKFGPPGFTRLESRLNINLAFVPHRLAQNLFLTFVFYALEYPKVKSYLCYPFVRVYVQFHLTVPLRTMSEKAGRGLGRATVVSWRAAVRAALTMRRTSTGSGDSRGSSWFDPTWTGSKLRTRLVRVARRGCRTTRRAACSSWSADDERRGVLPAMDGWVSGDSAGFADRLVLIFDLAWVDSLEIVHR